MTRQRSWVVLAILLAGCGQASPDRDEERPLFLIGREPSLVKIGHETRPALRLSKGKTPLAIPGGNQGKNLVFALGLRMERERSKRRLLVAKTVSGKTLKPSIRRTPAPSKKVIPVQVTVRNSSEESRTFTLTRESWSEHRLKTAGTGISFDVSSVPPGEAVFLGDPILLPPGKPSARGFLLVSIDTLRKDFLGCYGSPRGATPFLDKLSREALLCENAESTTPWTLPAHLSMLSSRFGSELGALSLTSSCSNKEPTLPLLLRRSGYLSVALVNHLLLSEVYGFARGFSIYRRRQGEEASKSARELLDLIEETRPLPFFAFLHLFDPHMDYVPKEPWMELVNRYHKAPIGGRTADLLPYFPRERAMPKRLLDRVTALYAGEIAATDHAIGRLRASLGQTGLGKTPLFVTADHGEAFEEHGTMGHGHDLHEELTGVPLLILDHRRAGLHRPPVSLLDVAPTILDILDVEIPAAFAGKPIGTARKTPVLAENWMLGRHQAMARLQDRKVILDLKRSQAPVRFDLAADPGEHHPLRPDDLGDAARWLAHAFEPGGHLVSRKAGEGSVPIPGFPSLFHTFRKKGQEGSRVEPAEVRRQYRLARDERRPVRFRVVPPGSIEQSAKEIETLRRLGYVE